MECIFPSHSAACKIVTMLKVRSVHAALSVCSSISHCSECDDKSDFSGSKELKDKLISSPIL